MTTQKMLFMSTVLAVLLGSSSMVSAQETIDIQNFNPHIGPDNIFSIEGSGVFGHMSPGAGVILNYASRPLVLTKKRSNAEDRQIAVVDQQLAAHIMLGLGLFDFLQLEFGVPAYAVNDGDTSALYDDGRGRAFSRGSGGDVSLRLKGNLWSGKRLGVALALEGRLPSGDSTAFAGEIGPILQPALIADLKLGQFTIAANTSVRLRSVSDVQNVELGPEINYGLGAQWMLMDNMVALGAELFGRTQFLGDGGGELELRGNPLEALVGVKLMTPAGFSIMTGAGGGVISGYGAPEFRAIVGVTYTKPVKVEPEFKDLDKDGIEDVKDACPNKAEDKDNFQDEDGCPDLDDDNDGIMNEDDKCPNKAEDKDNYKDADGCPDPDNDNDGILDDKDKCPNQPEDKDGFEDSDGCLDADNDKDGVLDKDDKCPDKAGTKLTNGCPVVAKKIRKFTKIVLQKKRIELLEKVFFEFDKAVIKTQSYPLLDEIVELLKQYPQIKLVEIAGHTDLKGKRKYNKTLSRDRAAAVKKYLLDKGVESARLKSTGYGMSKPLIKKEKSKEDSAKNRRVEFNILKQDTITEKKLVTDVGENNDKKPVAPKK